MFVFVLFSLYASHCYLLVHSQLELLGVRESCIGGEEIRPVEDLDDDLEYSTFGRSTLDDILLMGSPQAVDAAKHRILLQILKWVVDSRSGFLVIELFSGSGVGLHHIVLRKLNSCDYFIHHLPFCLCVTHRFVELKRGLLFHITHGKLLLSIASRFTVRSVVLGR